MKQPQQSVSSTPVVLIRVSVATFPGSSADVDISTANASAPGAPAASVRPEPAEHAATADRPARDRLTLATVSAILLGFSFREPLLHREHGTGNDVELRLPLFLALQSRDDHIATGLFEGEWQI